MMNNKEVIRLLRNLPTMCEFTDAYGESIDSDAYYEAVDMAISALQAQDSPKPTAESVQNVQNEDLISRKAAIDALHTWFRDGFDEDRWWNSTHVLAALEGLPSAQPNLQPTCNQLATDVISRQEAIDILNQYALSLNPDKDSKELWKVKSIKSFIEQLPPAQPDTKAQLSREDTTSDCISRQDAIDAVGYYSVHSGDKLLFADNALKKLPSAQPVGTSMHDSSTDYAHGFADGYKKGLKDAQPEIVQCKDCKYYKQSEWLLPHMCCHYLIGSTVVRKSDDFCSRAERRTE